MQIAHLEFQLDSVILTQRTLRFRIGPQDVSLAMDQAARKIRDEVAVPGFRKGKAPIVQIRRHHRDRVAADAFSELRQAAQDQVFKQLDDGDKPFLPAEVLDRERLKLRYGRPLEFAIKYMVDPAGIGQRPEHPQPEQGAVIPGAQVRHPAVGPPGIPSGPVLPSTPSPAPATKSSDYSPGDEG
jgi:hypothetical protein